MLASDFNNNSIPLVEPWIFILIFENITETSNTKTIYQMKKGDNRECQDAC